MRIILYSPEQDPMSSPRDRLTPAEDQPERAIRQALKAAMALYLPSTQVWEQIRNKILAGGKAECESQQTARP